MKKNPFENRSPIYQLHSERYLLIVLLSFAGSVSITRLFLELSGYPKLGSGEIHIAHVLWGGLFLFASSLLPLIFANRWAYTWSAIFFGIGVGLFIDEVGKFITETNDYFYPSAAPIVYAVFLITLLIFLNTRRKRKQDARSELYALLQGITELLDGDLSHEERDQLLKHIDYVKNNSEKPELNEFVESIEIYLHKNLNQIVPHHHTLIEKLQLLYLDFEKKHISQKTQKLLLIISISGLGIYFLNNAYKVISSFKNIDELQILMNNLINNRLIRNASGLNWFEARVGLEGTIGIVLIIGAVLFILNREKLAFQVSTVSIVVMIGLVNLLIFYFDQFSSIISASFEFLILLNLIRYQSRFMKTSDNST